MSIITDGNILLVNRQPQRSQQIRHILDAQRAAELDITVPLGADHDPRRQLLQPLVDAHQFHVLIHRVSS